MNVPRPTPLPLDLPPMEAEAVDELPSGGGWQYEPKYDGFRCIAHRHGPNVHLQSKNQKPLERYFPEVARGLLGIEDEGFVLDGELVVAGGSFEYSFLAGRTKKRAGALFLMLVAYRATLFISSVAEEMRSPSGAAISFAAEV